jgi:hypothetical protein
LSFLHSPVTLSLLGPNILLSTLFSNTLNVCSHNLSDQVLHPCKTTGKIICLYILIFTFLNSKLEDKRFCTVWYQVSPDFSVPLISSWTKFWFVRVVPSIFLTLPLQRNYYNSLYCNFIQLSDLEAWPYT